MKNVEFIRSGYVDGDKDKGMMQHPVFKSKDKIVYECKTELPETEKQVISKFQMLERLEKSSSWSSSVQTVIVEQKDMMLRRLMNIRMEAQNV
jgi:hypothetical protein